jgi:glycosyltransferase involved in cell wall biosynthesis
MGSVLNVLLVSGIYPPDIGGPATYVPELHAFLRRNDVNVRVITLSDDPKSSRFRFKDVIFINRNLTLPLRFVFVIINIAWQARNTDAIFANGLHEETAIACLLFRKNMVAKIVGDPIWERSSNSNETQLDVNEFQSFKLNFKRSIQRKLLKFALNQFNYVTCPSEELCEIVSAWGVKKPIKFIPNGIKEVPLDTNSDEKEFEIVTASRLVKWKNIDLLISSLKDSKYKLLILGNGPERNSLEKLAKNLGVDVTFLGEVTSDSVRQHMSTAKYFALLSSYEGMSFALLQAMSLGLIPIVSNCTGNVEVVDNNVDGFVVELRDLTSICDLISKLEADKSLRKKISKNSRLKVKLKYSLESNLQRTTELIMGQKIVH